jgi:hypothetical protein
MADEVDVQQVRHAGFVGWCALVVGLLLAFTPLWHVLTLGPAPTFEEVSQLICKSGADVVGADVVSGPRGIVSEPDAPLNAPAARSPDDVQAARSLPVRE